MIKKIIFKLILKWQIQYELYRIRFNQIFWAAKIPMLREEIKKKQDQIKADYDLGVQLVNSNKREDRDRYKSEIQPRLKEADHFCKELFESIAVLETEIKKTVPQELKRKEELDFLKDY